jgi:hypothetical protein
VHEWLRSDDDTGSVRADISRDAFERAGDVDQPLLFLVRLVRLAKLRDLLDRVVQSLRAPLPDRHELGQAIGVAQRHLQNAPDVADRGLRRHRRERDDLGHAVGPVLLRDVADDLFTALDREVAVDVGHRHAVDVEEALEDQTVLQWIEVGDAEAKRDQASCCAAAAGSDDDALLAREVVKVPDDQEVRRVAGLADHRKLELGALVGRRGRFAVPPFEAFEDQLPEVLIRRHPVGDVERRQEGGAQLQLEVNLVGHVDGAGQGVG